MKEQRVTITDTRITYLDNPNQVVMDVVSKDLMKAYSNIVCQNKGKVLDVGFGLGYSADAIYNTVGNYTCIEINPQIYQEACKWAQNKSNVKIYLGDWIKVIPEMAYRDITFDGIFMDTYGLQALWHMKTYGTTQRQIAFAASKNHLHGSLNEKAQYQFKVSVEDVLKDREISYPLTRAMCAPIGDGAAAALICSEKGLKHFPTEIQQSAIKIKASVLSGGKYRTPQETGLSRVAAKKAYRQAELEPKDINFVEVHDATSFCEIYQLEMLGFCEIGSGGKFVEEGHTQLGGRLPVNLSGGLVSKGHPVGATGLSMIHELAVQLRGEAGKRQSERNKIGLAENGGGVIGFEEAACSVIILEGSHRDQ